MNRVYSNESVSTETHGTGLNWGVKGRGKYIIFSVTDSIRRNCNTGKNNKRFEKITLHSMTPFLKVKFRDTYGRS